MTLPDAGTRRLVAVILGVLGLMVLLDVLIIAVLSPGANFDGVRQVLLLVVGGLLVVSGAVSFSWPQRRGNVETRGQDDAS